MLVHILCQWFIIRSPSLWQQPGVKIYIYPKSNHEISNILTNTLLFFRVTKFDPDRLLNAIFEPFNSTFDYSDTVIDFGSVLVRLVVPVRVYSGPDAVSEAIVKVAI
jgi:hypothetical protein